MLSHDDLAERAGVHPWQLRDDLADGDPGEISRMASAWARAGGHAANANTFAREASQRTADSYTVNDAAVHDAAASVAETNRQLGLGGDEMGRVAKLLDGISDRLTESTTKTQAEVSALESELLKINDRWLQTAPTAAPKDQESARNRFIEEAVQAVRHHGGTVRTEVESYEDFLAQNLRSLADLGLIPPDPIDFGPGDVNSTDSGSQAADSTITAAKANDAEGVEDATRYVDLLNHKRQRGADLTDAETAYLRDYYNTITPHLPEIKSWADRVNALHTHDDAAPNPALRETQLAGRVADGLLTLSHEVTYCDLPEPVRRIVGGHLGSTDSPKGGYGHDGVRLPVRGDEVLITAPGSIGGDANLRRYAGFMDFMDDYATPNAKPSDEFAWHLGNSALRWKHQINVMEENYIQLAEQSPHLPNDKPDREQWAREFPDELASDALGLVGRNADFSNDWIKNHNDVRRTLMGTNWQHGSGAAEVILAGTLPSDQHGDVVTRQEAAWGALAVVRDASVDYDRLADTANSDVKAAIGVMGSAYIDSFALEPTKGADHPIVDEIKLPNGVQVWGFQLDKGTHGNFLKYLAASDPEVFGQFRVQADTRASWYLEEALRAGHLNPKDVEYEVALNRGMFLHGSLEGASAGVLVDAAAAGTDRDVIAAEQDWARVIADYERAKSITDGMSLVVDMVGLVPGKVGDGASAAGIGFGALTDRFLEKPEGIDYGTYIRDLEVDVRSLAKAHIQGSRAEANMDDSMAHIIARAHADAGLPTTYRGDGGAPVAPVPDDDGQMPIAYRNHLRNTLPLSALVQGNLGLHSVISTESGKGSGYEATWTTGSPPRVGSLHDAGGNWSNEDDRYRIFYGGETRYDYKPPRWFSSSEWRPEVPDGKADTRTEPVNPDRLPPVR